MKPNFLLGAFALSLALPGVALAADMPARAPPPPPPPVDPLAAIITPIGTTVGAVINGVIITPLTGITTAILPSAPPAPVVARY